MRTFNKYKRIGFFVMLIMIAIVSLSSPLFAQQSAFDDPGSRQPANAGGDLLVVDGSINAGTITLGSSSQVVILMKNESTRPIQPGAISLYPSSNVSATVGENECNNVALPPEAVCAIAISVKGLQLGNFRVEMLLRHDGKSKLVTSTVSGDVDASGDQRQDVINDIEAIPNDLNFGSLQESRSLTRSLILRNVTSQEIEIGDLDIESNEAAGYSLKSNCTTLLSGGACAVTVTWAPKQRGPATGALVVNHSGPSSVVSIVLDGNYEPEAASEVGIFPEAVPGKGLLTSSQTEINFGSAIEAESAITASLVNIGDEDLEIEDIRLAGEDSGIQILSSGCRSGKILKPVEACPLTLKWSPVRIGSILDDVQIRHNGARGILVLPVRGTASAAINRDSQSIVIGGNNFANVPKISSTELDLPPSSESSASRVNVQGSLEGYRVTSLARDRAIISGPGGSRVVFDGEETVIGGVLWDIVVKKSAVEFVNGQQRVLLLFDRSLSGFNSSANSSSGTSQSSNSNSSAPQASSPSSSGASGATN